MLPLLVMLLIVGGVTWYCNQIYTDQSIDADDKRQRLSFWACVNAAVVFMWWDTMDGDSNFNLELNGPTIGVLAICAYVAYQLSQSRGT